MGELFFTADLHIGHRLVAGLRGFGEDIAAHDATLAANWDAVVRTGDQVWVLGDLCVGGKQRQEDALAWVRARPGEKHLIAGNHDQVHPMHRDSHKYLEMYYTAFKSVQAFARRKIDGQVVLLSHFPYDGDHTEQTRYAQYRLPDRGELLLHGHVHSPVQKTGRQIHVGLDAWGLRPVRLSEVVALVNER